MDFNLVSKVTISQKLDYVDLSTPGFHRTDNIKFNKHFYKFHMKIPVQKQLCYFCTY